MNLHKVLKLHLWENFRSLYWRDWITQGNRWDPKAPGLLETGGLISSLAKVLIKCIWPPPTLLIFSSLCNRPLRSAGSPRLCLPQLAARACHHSLQILGDNPRAQKPPLWPLQKYSRMIHMCTRYLAHTQSGRNGHSIHPNEAHIFLKRGSQRSPHHGRYEMG